jgi:hypothetical protein
MVIGVSSIICAIVKPVSISFYVFSLLLTFFRNFLLAPGFLYINFYSYFNPQQYKNAINLRDNLWFFKPTIPKQISQRFELLAKMYQNLAQGAPSTAQGWATLLGSLIAPVVYTVEKGAQSKENTLAIIETGKEALYDLEQSALPPILSRLQKNEPPETYEMLQSIFELKKRELDQLRKDVEKITNFQAGRGFLSNEAGLKPTLHWSILSQAKTQSIDARLSTLKTLSENPKVPLEWRTHYSSILEKQFKTLDVSKDFIIPSIVELWWF